MRPGGGAVFRATLRPVFVAARDGLVRLVERRYGIRTSGVIELDELGIAAPDRVRYKPAPWLALRRALPRGSVGADDVFVDFGSGMGRVVFQAAMRVPIQAGDRGRAVGTAARGGAHQHRPHRHRLRARRVELVHGDVMDYEVPDDVTVAFFDNPFVGRIFATVVDRLIASVDQAPRRLRIIYFNPVEHERLMATGRVRLVRRISGLRPGREWALSNATHVYAVAAAASSAAG